ncbi:MAG: WG repeat-containing protein [Bacteroidia bacterium]|nr:WG repeat-containing protein [Bacteroidia bacterium]
MPRYFLLFLFISITSFLLAEPYLVFEENGKVGIKNEEGQILLPASFEALGWSDGSFSIIGQVTGYKIGNAWGLVNLKKEFITKAVYERVFYSGGDRIIVFKKLGPTSSHFGCIDLKGNITVPFKYDGIKIQGLRAIVFIKNGVKFEHGLIDLQDREIIPLKFKKIYPIGSLRYAVENFESKTALYTERGIKLTDFVIDSIASFQKGKAVIHQELKQGLIDREGEIIIDPLYREIKIDEEGVVSTRSFDEWRTLDGENHELKKIFADELTPLTRGLYGITVSDKKGVTDAIFNYLIPPQYDGLGDFHSDKLVAKQNGKFGVIRINGTEVFPFTFDSLLWDGQFIRAKEGNYASYSTHEQKGWNLYDTFGIKKTNQPYENLGAYNGKYFPARNKGYEGAVNRYGEEFIHCVYDSILEFKDEQLAVKFQGQYGIITLDEQWLLMPQQYPVRLLNEEKYLEMRPFMMFLKSFAGEIIYFTDNKFDLNADHFLEYLPDSTTKVVSLDGQTISRTSSESVFIEDEIFESTEGLLGIKRDGLYGFIDDKGRLRIANRYEAIGQFREGLAPVKILGKWGFINAQDNIVINPNYESTEEFFQDLAIVKKNGKWGVINKVGKTILPMRYDAVKRLEAQKFLIISESRHGLADENGNVLIEPQYDRIEHLMNGYVIVEKENKFGLLTLDGLSTIPLIYDKIVYDTDMNQYLALKRAKWKPLNVIRVERPTNND